METNCINLKTNNKTDMSTTYLSVDYFPLTVNFFDRDAIELDEAKYGTEWMDAVCKTSMIKYSKKDIHPMG